MPNKTVRGFPFFDRFFNQDPRKSTCEVGWQQQFCAKTSQQPGRVLEGQVLWEVYWFNLRNQSREIGTWKQVQAPIASRFQLFTLVLADNFTSRCKAIEEARYSTSKLFLYDTSSWDVLRSFCPAFLFLWDCKPVRQHEHGMVLHGTWSLNWACHACPLELAPPTKQQIEGHN